MPITKPATGVTGRQTQLWAAIGKQLTNGLQYCDTRNGPWDLMQRSHDGCEINSWHHAIFQT